MIFFGGGVMSRFISWFGTHFGRLPSGFLSVALISAVAVFDGGCGTWLGNPKNPTDSDKGGGKAIVRLDFKGQRALGLTANFNVIGKGGNVIGRLDLTAAKVALKEIRFEGGADNAADFHFNGPYVVDLLTDSVVPDPGSAEIGAGVYKEMRLKMARLESDDAAQAGIAGDMVEKSILLQGIFTATGGGAKTFAMTFRLDEEFRILNDQGVDIAEGTHDVNVAFDLARWLDFSSSETNSDQVDLLDLEDSAIVLSEDGEELAKKIHEVIKENIKNSARFAKEG